MTGQLAQGKKRIRGGAGWEKGKKKSGFKSHDGFPSRTRLELFLVSQMGPLEGNKTSGTEELDSDQTLWRFTDEKRHVVLGDKNGHERIFRASMSAWHQGTHVVVETLMREGGFPLVLIKLVLSWLGRDDLAPVVAWPALQIAPRIGDAVPHYDDWVRALFTDESVKALHHRVAEKRSVPDSPLVELSGLGSVLLDDARGVRPWGTISPSNPATVRLTVRAGAFVERLERLQRDALAVVMAESESRGLPAWQRCRADIVQPAGEQRGECVSTLGLEFTSAALFDVVLAHASLLSRVQCRLAINSLYMRPMLVLVAGSVTLGTCS